MPRYIDADKAVERIVEATEAARLGELTAQSDARLFEYRNLKNGLIKAYRIIEKTPTADVAEVRHGRWIPVVTDDLKDKLEEITPFVLSFVQCSECGMQSIFKYPYCNCGAKMDGGRE